MKRWLIISLVGIFCLSFYTVAEARVAIDWWGLWGANETEFGEMNAPLYGEGLVDGGTLFADPLFADAQNAVIENAYYTWSAAGLTVIDSEEIAPGLWNVEYGGGSINFYYDSDPYNIGGNPEIQDWTNPHTTAQFTDGVLILSANFTKFNLLWNDVNNIGQVYSEMTFTGGSWLNDLPGTNGIGGAFASQLFINPDLYPAYVVDSDGSINVNVIPEPGSLLLLASGLVSFLMLKKRNS